MQNQDILLIRDIRINEAIAKSSNFDILMVPGGADFAAHVPDFPGIKSANKGLLKAWDIAKAPSLGIHLRWTVTGKYASLGELKKLCDTQRGSSAIRQHYVDCVGFEGNEMEKITLGGITSGIDANLYLVEKLSGLGMADKTSAAVDAVWRREALPAGL